MVKRRQIFGFGRAMGIATLVLCLIAVLPISKAVADEVAQWNETTMKAIAANGQNILVRRARWPWCRGPCTTP